MFNLMSFVNDEALQTQIAEFMQLAPKMDTLSEIIERLYERVNEIGCEIDYLRSEIDYLHNEIAHTQTLLREHMNNNGEIPYEPHAE